MTYFDDLAAAFEAAQPAPPVVVRTGTIATINTSATPRTVTVTMDGSDPVPCRWSASFDLSIAASGTNLEGQLVILLMIDGQPWISDVSIGA